MSQTKASGSTHLGRDSKPKYLGVKKYEGQIVKPGMIIIKQRGTKFIPGVNVKKGRDDTLYAMKEGKVNFQSKKKRKFSGVQTVKKIVNVN
jgi:large subunit ribosomal protein L27